MHIGVISDTRFKTDPRIRNEVRFLSQQSHQISVLNITYDSTDRTEMIDGAKVFDVSRSQRWQKTFRGIQNILPIYENFWRDKIKEFISMVSPDVIHVHDLYMAHAASLATQDSSIPMVLDLHENFPAAIQSYSWANQFPKKILVQPKMWVKKEGRYLHYADKLVVLSDHYKQILSDRYDFIQPDNVFVYPNVPDVQKLRSYPIQQHTIGDKNDTVLFYFGAIAFRRGVHVVLDALLQLIPQGEKFHLLLIGPIDTADEAMFQKYLNDPVLQNHITYYPWKDISEFPSYALASDIGISPLIKNDQHESGIANKVYQYMLFERPVLVSNCRPQQDLIEKHHCGWVFESENVEDLTRVLKTISRSANLQQMGENGREAIEREENLENKGEELRKLYHNISQDL